MKIARRKLIFGLFAIIAFAGIIRQQVKLKKKSHNTTHNTNSFSINIYLNNSSGENNGTVIKRFGLEEVSLIDGFVVSSKELGEFY